MGSKAHTYVYVCMELELNANFMLKSAQRGAVLRCMRQSTTFSPASHSRKRQLQLQHRWQRC
jgi:hypothetical protein